MPNIQSEGPPSKSRGEILEMIRMLSDDVGHQRRRQRDVVLLYASLVLALSSSLHKDLIAFDSATRALMVAILAVIAVAAIWIGRISRARGKHYKQQRQKLVLDHFEIEYSPDTKSGEGGVTMFYEILVALFFLLGALFLSPLC